MEREYHGGGGAGVDWKTEATRWRAEVVKLSAVHAQAGRFLTENAMLRVQVAQLQSRIVVLTGNVTNLVSPVLVGMTTTPPVPADADGNGDGNRSIRSACSARSAAEPALAPIQRGTPAWHRAGAGHSETLFDWLAGHNLALLRVSMGAIVFTFGALKYFPGVSAAENLVLATTHILAFGLVPDRVAMALLATVECAIGLSLMTGLGLRVTRYFLVLWAVSILSPIALLSGRLFMGPHHAPTLEGQYVLKDLILLTASLLIATALPLPGGKKR